MSVRFIFAIVLAGRALLANPITLTFSGTATGTFAGTPFTSVPYVVTSTADTSAVIEVVTPCSPTNPACPVFTLPAISSQIAIQGFPVATFTDPTSWNDPNFSGDVIFQNSGSGILGITALFSGLETYNLQSSFGPVTSSIDFETQFFNAFLNIPTTQGLLSLVAMNETFTAATAPEPATTMSVVLGITLVAVRRRQKNKAPNK